MEIFFAKQPLTMQGNFCYNVKMINIVLFQPEIPHNTGAIARSCYVTGSKLHLIRPLGFHLDEKSVARAGLDYWELMDIADYADWSDFLGRNPFTRLFFAETRVGVPYSEAQYQAGDFIVFGGETKGLPNWLLDDTIGQTINIPMKNVGRSLNLSVSVGIILFEALRQNGFGGLQ